jgi:hypothetical protein
VPSFVVTDALKSVRIAVYRNTPLSVFSFSCRVSVNSPLLYILPEACIPSFSAQQPTGCNLRIIPRWPEFEFRGRRNKTAFFCKRPRWRLRGTGPTGHWPGLVPSPV